jgi:hypothetical protein
MPNLKKTIFFNIADEQTSIDVTWSVLEKVERVYNLPCDLVPYMMQDATRVPRSKVADIVTLLLQDKTKKTREEVKEFYFSCSQKAYIRDIGKIQAAILWALRDDNNQPMISDAAFEALVNGRDLPEEPEKPTPAPKSVVSKQKKRHAAT